MAGRLPRALPALSGMLTAGGDPDHSAEPFMFEAMPHGRRFPMKVPGTQEAVDVTARFFLKHLGTRKG